MIGTPPRNIWSRPGQVQSSRSGKERSAGLRGQSEERYCREVIPRIPASLSDTINSSPPLGPLRSNRAAQSFSLRSRRQCKAWGVSPGNESKKNIPSPRGGQQRERYGSGCVFHGIADPKGTTLPPAFAG